jgi:hypothetical protein
MKPHPRIRKTIKWGGAAVTVLLVVVWIGSGWYAWYWQRKDGTAIGVAHGLFWVTISDFKYDWTRMGAPRHRFGPLSTFVPDFGLEIYVDPGVGPRFYDNTASASGGNGPLTTSSRGYFIWPLAAFSLMATGLAWGLDSVARRRARVGRCPKCNYDRAGIPGNAKCPECGTGGKDQMANGK